MSFQLGILQANLTHMFDRAIFWLVNVSAYLRHFRNIMLFRRAVGYFPNVAVPRRYNEKMLWRKIFDHNPLFVTFSDKLATKKLWADRRPDLATAAVLWTGCDAAHIPGDLFKRPVVIKANHGSGMNTAIDDLHDPQSLPVDRINSWLDWDFGKHQFEWAYEQVDRRLFLEELIACSKEFPVIDISIHACDGHGVFVEVICANKTDDQQKAYFKTDGTRWREIERSSIDGDDDSSLPETFSIPANYRKALDHVRDLSSGIDYARFDFLSVADRLFGGEITVYPNSGLTPHAPFITYNKYLTEHWDLLKSWFLTRRQPWMIQVYASALRRQLARETGRH